MRSFGNQAVVVAVLVVAVLVVSGADQAGRHPSAVMAALREVAAVAMVAAATALVWLAVRAVSDRRVVRRPHYESSDPPLPRHVHETAPVDDYRAAPGYSPASQAPALPFPGREPVSDRSEVPQPETEEVPR